MSDIRMINRNIREIGEEKGLTPEMLAERMNAPAETVWKWWTGARMPTACGLFKIARAYGVPMEKLMEGVGI